MLLSQPYRKMKGYEATHTEAGSRITWNHTFRQYQLRLLQSFIWSVLWNAHSAQRTYSVESYTGVSEQSDQLPDLPHHLTFNAESSTRENCFSPVFHPLKTPWDCTSRGCNILNSSNSPTYWESKCIQKWNLVLTLFSTAATERQQYTLSRRIILFSDIDIHIAVTVTLPVFIYQH